MAMVSAETMAGFVVMALIFVGLSFVIVLFIRPVPHKLILLGLLTAVTGIGFGAVLPPTAKLALIMVILAVSIVLVGLICILVSFVVQSVRTGNTSPKEP